MMNEDMNNGTVNNTNVGLLGDYLKQKRIDRNFSLEKLSQKTKISVNILKSLEANDFEHLPSAAYIKGFVTSYVKVLGLPLDEAISKMEATYLTILGKPFPALNHTKLMSSSPMVQSAGVKGPSEEEQTPHEVIESSDSLIQNTKPFLPVLIFGAVILVFIGGYKLVSSIVENEVSGQKNVDLGPKIESSSALVNRPPKTETPKASPEAAAPQNTPAENVAEVKKDEAKPAAEFERNFPFVDFKKITGTLFSVKTDAPENEDPNILPESIKNAVNPDLQNVYIKAVSGNTWLSYKIDNNPIESVIINKGNDLFIQGTEIRLFLGNVNVTKIFYNNYLIDTPTKSGVKSLVFPQDKASKYSLPLFPKAKDDILYTEEDYVKRMKLEEEELKKRQQ